MESNFSLTFSCQGFLFDLDGTLIDSLPAVDRCWRKFARRHKLNEEEILHQIHGRRSIDSIRAFLPNVDAEAENNLLRACESTDTEGVVAFPGAVEFLHSLPPERWGIVTSGTSDVALARMEAAGIPRPAVCVFGEDVVNGKPAPDAFQKGGELLNLPPNKIIAFEDAPAGITAIQMAGMIAVGVNRPEFDPSISNFLGVEVSPIDNHLLLTLSIPEEARN